MGLLFNAELAVLYILDAVCDLCEATQPAFEVPCLLVEGPELGSKFVELTIERVGQPALCCGGQVLPERSGLRCWPTGGLRLLRHWHGGPGGALPLARCSFMADNTALRMVTRASSSRPPIINIFTTNSFCVG